MAHMSPFKMLLYIMNDLEISKTFSFLFSYVSFPKILMNHSPDLWWCSDQDIPEHSSVVEQLAYIQRVGGPIPSVPIA